MFDGAAFGKDMVEIVKGYMAREMAALVSRISHLETKLAEAQAFDPVPFIQSAVEKAVSTIRVPEDGKDVDMDDVGRLIAEAVEKAFRAIVLPEPDVGLIRAAVADEIAKIPPAEPGKDADPINPEVVRKMVAEIVEPAVAAIPAPKNGESVTLDDVKPLIADAVAKAVSAIPSPRNGVGVAGAIIGRDGALILTLTDGSTKNLGVVVGKDADFTAIDARIKEMVAAIPRPRDGVDGVGFDDLDLIEDERGVVLRFQRGDVVKDFALPIPVDRGVWTEKQHKKGACVTWGGSLWIAQRDTEAKPDSPDSGWRLAVKRGRDGKDAK